MGNAKIPLVILTLALVGIFILAIMMYMEKEGIVQDKSQLEQEIGTLKEQLTSLQRENVRLQEERSNIEQAIRRREDESSALRRERDDLQSRINQIRGERDSLAEQLAAKAAQQPLPPVKPETVTVTPDTGIAQLSDDYWADFVREKAELQVNIERLNKELSNLQRQIPELDRKNKELSIKIDELSRERVELERKIEFKERSLELVSKDLVSERQSRRKVEQELEVMRSDNINLKREFIMVDKERAGLYDKFKSTLETKDHLERRIANIENVLKKKSFEIAEMHDQLLSSVRGAAVSDKTAVELPPIVVRPDDRVALAVLEGQIIAVNQAERFVVIDVGEDAGVRPGVKFNVQRGGRTIGWIEVIEARREISAADIKEVISGDFLKEGDKIALQ